MCLDVCESGMNNFAKSTPSAPFSFDEVAYGTRGVWGKIQFCGMNDICVIIFVPSIVQGEFS